MSAFLATIILAAAVIIFATLLTRLEVWYWEQEAEENQYHPPDTIRIVNRGDDDDHS